MAQNTAIDLIANVDLVTPAILSHLVLRPTRCDHEFSRRTIRFDRVNESRTQVALPRLHSGLILRVQDCVRFRYDK